jgi:hypothetical protein
LSRLSSTKDECVILVKALPHRSSNYYETVCCAGVGRDRKWRRLYPVPFRVLEDGQKFGRWNWVDYEFTPPASDARRESQKVVPESINVSAKLKESERSALACHLTRESVEEASALHETLTLIKPVEVGFTWVRKSDEELATERRKHAELVQQLSMFDKPAKPYEPCPFEFRFRWKSPSGKVHNHTCDDWETSTAFFRRRERHGEADGLQSLKITYEDDYPKKGMRFALGTHSRRSDQWLLVGVLRVDENSQLGLNL